MIRSSKTMLVKKAIFLPIIILLAVSGCTSTQMRINNNIAYFQSLPIQHQTLIRKSRIAIGFIPQEVYLAWGPPDHKAVTPGIRGPAKETWFYTRNRPATGAQTEKAYDPESKSWQDKTELQAAINEFIVKQVFFKRGFVHSWTIHYSNLIPFLPQAAELR